MGRERKRNGEEGKGEKDVEGRGETIIDMEDEVKTEE